MELNEESGYLTVYQDEDYTIWIDTAEQIISIFLEESGETLDFSYEDFHAFREAINSVKTLI
ncbi:hypothetical protein ACFL6S_08640 [Candidatus Poribacteria bacterium]